MVESTNHKKTGTFVIVFYVYMLLCILPAIASSEDDYADAYSEYIKGNYKDALRLYIKLAEQGNVWAEYNIGTMYENGVGVNKDIALAVLWFRKASEQGYQPATTKLATLEASIAKEKQIHASESSNVPQDTPQEEIRSRPNNASIQDVVATESFSSAANSDIPSESHNNSIKIEELSNEELEYNLNQMLELASSNDEERILSLAVQMMASSSKAHIKSKAARSFNDQAVSYIKTGNFPLALQTLSKAYKIDPLDTDILTNYCLSLSKTGQYNEMKEYSHRLLKLIPNRSIAWTYFGESYARLHDQNKSVSAFKLALLFSRNKEKTISYLKSLSIESHSSDVEQAVSLSLNQPSNPTQKQIFSQKTLETKTNVKQQNHSEGWGGTIKYVLFAIIALALLEEVIKFFFRRHTRTNQTANAHYEDNFTYQDFNAHTETEIETDTRNPEEVLGLRPGFTFDELRRAYKEHCQRLHPDKWQDRPDYFKSMMEEEQKKVNEAYNELKKRYV